MAKFTKNDIQKLQYRWMCFVLEWQEVLSARSLLDKESRANNSFRYESIAPRIEGYENLFAFCVRKRSKVTAHGEDPLGIDTGDDAN